MSPSPSPPIVAMAVVPRDSTVLSPNDGHKEPFSDKVISVILAIISVAIISAFMSKSN